MQYVFCTNLLKYFLCIVYTIHKTLHILLNIHFTAGKTVDFSPIYGLYIFRIAMYIIQPYPQRSPTPSPGKHTSG